ncbi:MAG: hypothetical protein ACKOYN_01915 [Planctomycetota bacterium]
MNARHGPDDGAGDRMDRPGNRTRRIFEPEVDRAPWGAASISLLVRLLDDRTRAGAWSDQRRRMHARALLELALDHDFSEAELAFLRRSAQ